MFGLLTADSLIDSFLVGLICGAIPFYFSAGRNRLKLGLAALAACLAGSVLLGVVLAVPISVFFIWRIFRTTDPRSISDAARTRSRRRAITLLALLGIFVAGYLTWSHYSGQPVYCGVSNSCEVVNTSRYAYLGPIPVALLGLIGYLTILGLSVIPAKEDRQWPLLLIFGGALIGALLQWYLFYIEVFVLRAICYWCVSSQTFITLIFFLALPRREETIAASETDLAAE